MGDELSHLLLLIAALFVASLSVLYVASPIVVYFVQRISAKPELIPFDAQATPLPQEAATHLGEVGAQLEAEGFTATPAFFLPRHAPRLKAFVRNYHNRRLSTVANVVVVFTEHGAGNWQPMAYTSFTTRYAGGGFVITNNISTLDVFRRREDRRVASLPTVKDVRRLLRCHRILCERHGGSHPEFPIEIEKDPRRIVEHAIVRDLDEQVQQGVFRLTDGGDFYRPTFKGAMQVTWWNLPPMRSVLAASRRRIEREVLQEEEMRAHLT